MDYAALKAEIELPAYAGMSDDDIAAALNAATVPVETSVSTKAIRRYMMLTGAWAKIALVSEGVNLGAGTPTIPHRVAAITALAAVGPGAFDDFDLQDSNVRAPMAAMLHALVEIGAISQSDKNAVLDLRKTTVSRASQIGWPSVGANDVAHARGG